MKPVKRGSAASGRRSVDLVADDFVRTADVRWRAVHQSITATRVARN